VVIVVPTQRARHHDHEYLGPYSHLRTFDPNRYGPVRLLNPPQRCRSTWGGPPQCHVITRVRELRVHGLACLSLPTSAEPSVALSLVPTADIDRHITAVSPRTSTLWVSLLSGKKSIFASRHRCAPSISSKLPKFLRTSTLNTRDRAKSITETSTTSLESTSNNETFKRANRTFSPVAQHRTTPSRRPGQQTAHHRRARSDLSPPPHPQPEPNLLPLDISPTPRPARRLRGSLISPRVSRASTTDLSLPSLLTSIRLSPVTATLTVPAMVHAKAERTNEHPTRSSTRNFCNIPFGPTRPKNHLLVDSQCGNHLRRHETSNLWVCPLPALLILPWYVVCDPALQLVLIPYHRYSMRGVFSIPNDAHTSPRISSSWAHMSRIE
ncbi:hypothetical protein C0995_011075, partial [Termitomyces sp. Mi166